MQHFACPNSACNNRWPGDCHELRVARGVLEGPDFAGALGITGADNVCPITKGNGRGFGRATSLGLTGRLGSSLTGGATSCEKCSSLSYGAGLYRCRNCERVYCYQCCFQ